LTPDLSPTDFEFVTRHVVLDYPEYWFEIDEYRRPDGAQFLLAHLRVEKFTSSILRRIDHEWRTFRACVSAPLFAVAEEDDAKWERFVARLGFKPFQEVICNNGVPRRLFISVPQDNHERFLQTNPKPKLSD
jgi:hypothetical protein